MQHSREIITPEIARSWLNRNVQNNRNLRDSQVMAYARAMVDGEWREGQGDPIRFTTGGQLIDGQHRLHAVILAGEMTGNAPFGIEMSVIRGLDPSALFTIDTGAKRTFGDVLKMLGHTDSNNLATVVRQAAIWKAGGRDGSAAGKISMSNDHLYGVLKAHPELESVGVSVGRGLSKSDLHLPCAITGGPWLAFHTLCPEDCEDFFTRLKRGDGHVEGDPIYALRFRVLQFKSQSRVIIPNRMYIALLCKAWNAYRNGNRVASSAFRYRTGGAHPEGFPEPI